jgi:hypothetical protein
MQFGLLSELLRAATLGESGGIGGGGTSTAMFTIDGVASVAAE